MKVVRRQRLFLCPLANDAVSSRQGRYEDLGPNSKLRINAAHDYSTRLHGVEVAWLFGAGTAPDYRHGHTLASLGRAYLHQLQPEARAYANFIEHTYYGTYEEMLWMVREAERQCQERVPEFVFFTQQRHLPRVRLIWWLFFRHHKARFVVTRHMAGQQLSWGRSVPRVDGSSSSRVVSSLHAVARSGWNRGNDVWPVDTSTGLFFFKNRGTVTYIQYGYTRNTVCGRYPDWEHGRHHSPRLADFEGGGLCAL